MAQAGASVTAVDRSPLDGEVSRNKRVAFIKGNAFTWIPPAPVDWLVCDVITTPDRTLAILRSWIEKRLCRNFCVTVKFKGDPDIPTLHQIASYLKSNTSWFDGRQLTHNKNELTVVGRVYAD
jgi:23S rRNA (cytidine2498-2'-O)-methyltransferase